jgi:hypothetical protein
LVPGFIVWALASFAWLIVAWRFYGDERWREEHLVGGRERIVLRRGP